MLSQSSNAKVPGKRGRQPGERPDDAKATRGVIGGEALLQIARAVVGLQPFLAPKVGDAWKELKTYLMENKFEHDVLPTTIQQKAKALVAFKKVSCL
jgi:hypothetical protein